MMKFFIALLVSTVLVSCLAACGESVTITGRKGVDLMITTPSKPIYIPESTGKRVMFLPFMNTAEFAHAQSVNMAYLNEKLTSSVKEITVPPGYRIYSSQSGQSKMSRVKKTREYANLLRDYVFSGLVDEEEMKTIMRKLKVDLLIQGILRKYSAGPENDHFNKAGIQFIAFDGETGAIRWKFFIEAEVVHFDRTKKESSRGLQIGMGFLATALYGGGFGMSLASVTEYENVNWGLFGGGFAMIILGAIPNYYAMATFTKDESEFYVSPYVVDEKALGKMIEASLDYIKNNLGWRL